MATDPADPTNPLRPPDPREIELARMSVSIPAVFLILNGVLGLVLIGLLAQPLVLDPEGMVDWLRNMAAQQPPGPDKQKLEEQIAELEAMLNADRAGYVRQNAIWLGAAGLCNLLAIIGGFFMRSLTGYGLALAGSAISLVPLATGCCCTGLPFGLWGLVSLTRPDIRAAFVAVRQSRYSARDAAAPSPDGNDPYLR